MGGRSWFLKEYCLEEEGCCCCCFLGDSILDPTILLKVRRRRVGDVGVPRNKFEGDLMFGGVLFGESFRTIDDVDGGDEFVVDPVVGEDVVVVDE